MGKRNKVTTRDIAEYVNLSQSTVSMILSRRANVSFTEETIRRVEEAARELGYKKPAAGIKKKEKNLAGSIIVICPTFSNSYYTMVNQSINQQAQKYGYTVFTVSTLRDAMLESSYLKLLGGFELTGIISLYPPDHMASANALSRQIPFVLIGDKPENCRFDSVELDSKKTGYIIGEHLLKLGHRQITFISSPIKSRDINRIYRLKGIQESFRDYGVDPELIRIQSPSIADYRRMQPDNTEYEIGYSQAAGLLQRRTESTAFIGNNDSIAYGIMAAISDYGYKIPRDISVCGFDNLPLSAMPQISLTTVEHAARQKGREAVDIIFRKHSQNKDSSGHAYIMRMEYEPELIVRKSTGKI